MEERRRPPRPSRRAARACTRGRAACRARPGRRGCRRAAIARRSPRPSPATSDPRASAAPGAGAPRARGAARSRRASDSSASGIDDQRKYDNRLASSWSETRYGPSTSVRSSSSRNRKLRRDQHGPQREPDARLRTRRREPRRGGTSLINRSTSSFPTGRRKARRANAARQRRAASSCDRPGPGRATRYRDGSASSSTSAAAARYFSIRIGGTNRVNALFSNPAPPPPSAGNASAGWVSTPSRSRIVLLYCRRVSRWIRPGPGIRDALGRVEDRPDRIRRPLAIVYIRTGPIARRGHRPLDQGIDDLEPQLGIAAERLLVLELAQVDVTLSASHHRGTAGSVSGAAAGRSGRSRRHGLA